MVNQMLRVTHSVNDRLVLAEKVETTFLHFGIIPNVLNDWIPNMAYRNDKGFCSLFYSAEVVGEGEYGPIL